MTHEEARRFAEAVAERLFVNGFGERAQRLVLTADTPEPRNLGGWGYGPLVDQVEAALIALAGRDREGA